MNAEKKQLAINLFSKLFVFVVGVVINFFLTPFVVDKLGREAYGFVGLATNFVNYTGLLTTALNSMAGRFISVSYFRGDVKTANAYFSSVFYSNIFLGIVIFVSSLFGIYFLEYLVDVPNAILLDVKILFFLTFLNSSVALFGNMYGIAPFLKNRIDLASIRELVSNIVRVLCLFVPFMIFKPSLSFYGLSAVVTTAYLIFANKRLRDKLTPDIEFSLSLFDWHKIRELLLSGVWNVISKLGEILSNGFDLLIANLFIGAAAMGTLSISKSVPFLCLSLCATIAGTFAPKLTEYFAKGEIDKMQNELINNVKIMGVFSVIPLIAFMVFGEDFYHLWMPTQDANQLYWLSAFMILELLIAMPMESFWNIFTITNKLKYSCITLFITSILIFSSLMICMNLIDDMYMRLMALSIVSFVWKGLRSLTFLPIYGAKCLKLKITTFYPILIRNLFGSVSIMFLLIFLKRWIVVETWLGLFMWGGIFCLVTVVSLIILLLDKEQKDRLKVVVLKQYNKRMERWYKRQ